MAEVVMKLIGAAFCLVACSALGAAAQTTETKVKTKVEVKDGKDITTTGCVAVNPGGGYMLTDTHGDLHYLLVTDRNLSKEVGRFVQVKGTATDRGNGKVKIESRTKVDVEHGKDKESKEKTEISGDMPGMPYLGVRSVKTLDSACR
jgi:hypothetical protein